MDRVRELNDFEADTLLAFDRNDEQNHVRYGHRWLPEIMALCGDARPVEEFVKATQARFSNWRKSTAVAHPQPVAGDPADGREDPEDGRPSGRLITASSAESGWPLVRTLSSSGMCGARPLLADSDEGLSPSPTGCVALRAPSHAGAAGAPWLNPNLQTSAETFVHRGAPQRGDSPPRSGAGCQCVGSVWVRRRRNERRDALRCG